jgi:hypothetical protein
MCRNTAFLITIAFPVCLVAQQTQPKSQAKPRQTQNEVVTIQGRDFRVPHVPADKKQASKEFRAANKEMASTLDILENELSALYGKYPADELFRSFQLPKSKLALPEVRFLLSVISDTTMKALQDEMKDMWNSWQIRIVDAGAGTADSYKGADKPRSFARTSEDRIAQQAKVLAKPGKKPVEERIKLINEIIMKKTIEDALKEEDEITSEYEGYELDLLKATLMGERDAIDGVHQSIVDEFLPKISMDKYWADARLIQAISIDEAPGFAKAWEPFMEYANARIMEFVQVEGDPLYYSDPDIKRMFDLASVVFFEQVRQSVWLCQNVWHRMVKITDTPARLKRLGPYILEEPDLKDPRTGRVVLRDLAVDTAMKRGARGAAPKLVPTRDVHPVYVPGVGELTAPESVNVWIDIAMDGSVSAAEALSGPEYLHEIAVRAAKCLNYLPLRDTGFTSTVATTVTFDFLPPTRN